MMTWINQTMMLVATLAMLSSCDSSQEFFVSKGEVEFIELPEPEAIEPSTEAAKKETAEKETAKKETAEKEEAVSDEPDPSQVNKLIEAQEPSPPPTEDSPTPREPQPPQGPCSDGMFRNPGTDLSECRPWTVCRSDQFETQFPTHERDRVCSANPCRRGTVPHTLATDTSPLVCRVAYRDCTDENGTSSPRIDEFYVPGKGCRIYFTQWIPGEPNNAGVVPEDYTHLKPQGWNDLPPTGDQGNTVQAGAGKILCASGEIPDLSNQSRPFTLEEATNTQRDCPQGSVFAKPETLEENRIVFHQFQSEIDAFFSDDPPLPVWINFYRERNNSFQVRNPFGP